MSSQGLSFFYLCFSLLLRCSSFVSSYDGPLYDSTAYTKCKEQPEKPLYNGGVLKDEAPEVEPIVDDHGSTAYWPTFLLRNLTEGTIYSFSSWVKINGADSATVRASLTTDQTNYDCIGTVVAKQGCWSFLKGGFVSSSSSNLSLLYFQNQGDRGINITIASTSLQPFTKQQWRMNQQYRINTERKRAVTIHVASKHGDKLQGAHIKVEQVSRDFPFGSAIAKTIIGNLAYQKWFVERFNAAVFENELKWYVTEPKPGQINYTLSDQMLEFVRANQIIARGHNIFWEDPKYTPQWVVNLTASGLQSAVSSRIRSLMSKYKEEFIHWDVSNEMLHWDFYEQRLGPNATLSFFETARRLDPLATLFMNEFNVVETCSDENSTVDVYVSRMRELKEGGISMDGIGLESHFTVPNLPLMRAVLDKLSTLGLPIWLTEVDISSKIDKETQVRNTWYFLSQYPQPFLVPLIVSLIHNEAIYLEEVLREGFSHPGVNGIMLWTALHPNGCYQMCLTDNDFNNLPAGDVVDKLLIEEWQTGVQQGFTDEHGAYSFLGFLGEYQVVVTFEDKTVNSSFSLCRGDETRHFNIQL